MTIAAVIAALVLLAGAVVYIATRVVLPLATRHLDLQAKRLEISAQRSNRAPPAKPETIPLDMLALALQWRDDWAKTDALKRYTELYEEHGDWSVVKGILSQRNERSN